MHGRVPAAGEGRPPPGRVPVPRRAGTPVRVGRRRKSIVNGRDMGYL